MVRTPNSSTILRAAAPMRLRSSRGVRGLGTWAPRQSVSSRGGAGAGAGSPGGVSHEVYRMTFSKTLPRRSRSPLHYRNRFSFSSVSVHRKGTAVMQADIVFTGGTVRTGAAEGPVCDALAVTGGRISALGAEALAARGPSTTVVDLRGGALLPAFGDGHVHPV